MDEGTKVAGRNRLRSVACILIRVLRVALVGFSVAILLLSLPLISGLLIGHLETASPLSVAKMDRVAQDRSAAIVVLSAGRRSYAPEFGAQTLDALSLERARYAAVLARRTGLPLLISGGLGHPGSPPLADLMADALEHDFRIQPRWLERQSRNTAENAILSTQILKRLGITRILLVTHAWHMKRARTAFIAQGMVVVPAPTAFYHPRPEHFWGYFVPSLSALRMSSYATHEIVGGWWYALRYGF